MSHAPIEVRLALGPHVDERRAARRAVDRDVGISQRTPTLHRRDPQRAQESFVVHGELVRRRGAPARFRRPAPIIRAGRWYFAAAAVAGLAHLAPEDDRLGFHNPPGTAGRIRRPFVS